MLVQIRHWTGMEFIAAPCIVTATALLYTSRIADPRERRRWLALAWGALAAYALVIAFEYALVGYPDRALALSASALTAVVVQVVVIACMRFVRA